MEFTSLDLKLPTFSELRAQQAAAERTRALQRRQSALMQRRFDAAMNNRFTSDWVAPVTSAGAELRQGLRTMRARSRDLAHNDGYMKKFLSMVRSNVIGPRGIRVQARAKTNGDELDSVLNRQVEDAWQRWCHKDTCTVSGKLSWLDVQNLAATQLARDGECLIRKVTAKNDFGFALKLIDVSYLSETNNQLLPNGNRILMSVEVDNDDRPVAYHLTTPYYDHLYPESGRVNKTVRVPASEIIHLFVCQEDETVTRGVPWTHAAMRNLRDLGEFIEAKVIGARVEACQMAFLIPPGGQEAQFTGADPLPVEVEASPGIFPQLPAGYDIKNFDPKHPNGNEGEFLKTMLKGIAVGFDVDYCTFASDLREVNYSSIRAGIQETREVWKVCQQFFIEHLHREVYLSWLRSAMLTGALEGVLPRDVDRLTEPKFLPRGWGYVNPQQDAEADEKRVANGFTTTTQVLADEGEDFEEMLVVKSEEIKLQTKYGVKVGPAPKAATEPADANQPADENAGK